MTPGAALIVVGTALAIASTTTHAMDVKALWNFNDPAQSEQRFRDALRSASGDDAFILQTQIARTYGLRGRFDDARALLKGLEPQLAGAGPEARTRYWLELGRTYSSAAHPPESQTADVKAQARDAYMRATDIAKAGHLDDLAVDALHMLAFVDTSPADQLQWGEAALAVAQSSPQPAAQAWEASLRNNIGYALLQLGRNEEALVQFTRAVELRERGSDREATWAAHWMVARALRALGRIDDAIAIQLRLERERAAAHAPDPEVFDELELLYRAKGDGARASHYASLRNAPK
jgi:tetratricopeptide (TPR) repeat protein